MSRYTTSSCSGGRLAPRSAVERKAVVCRMCGSTVGAMPGISVTFFVTFFRALYAEVLTVSVKVAWMRP